MSDSENVQEHNTFNCTDCGAKLKFKAGTQNLTCEYCGAVNKITQEATVTQELDFHEYLQKSANQEEKITVKSLDCGSCGATSTVDPNITADSCPYCATPFVMGSAKEQSLIKPKNLLPFELDKTAGVGAFKKWINGLWFAPNSLKKAALNPISFKGMYLPYWTYDSDTNTYYTGERGEYYYVTVGEGEDEKQERRTRWYSASGNISKFFDDVLIPATTSIPPKRLTALEPWDFKKLVNYDDKYLSGYQSECYAVDLEQGFQSAQNRMEKTIRTMARRQIGGDEQRIHSINTNYQNITFKHILLPVYVCAYRYQEKLYNFVINAQTGEVQGERPFSVIKIVATVITVLGIAGAIYYFYSR